MTRERSRVQVADAGKQLVLVEDAPSSNHIDWLELVASELGTTFSADWQSEFGRSLGQRIRASINMPIRTLSLFSGGGGLDIAFHDLGFAVTDMVEVESAFTKTLQANTAVGCRFEGATVHNVDIRDFDVSDGTHYDFIIGGPPCQTFSAAGRRAAGVLGTHDERGTLFEEYVRLLRKIQPRGFLFENVYAILGAQGGQPWREIIAAFREVGYELSYRILDAADYGVPQHRERLFIVGVRNDIALSIGKFRFPRPTHGPDSPARRPHQSAREALSGIHPLQEENLEVGGKYGYLLDEIPPGLNYSYFTAELGHPKPVFAWRSKFSDFLYKADPERPVRTIKAQGGAFTGPLSWENRHFSTPELKRLQTFPDDYQVVGSRGTAVHQIGNSVPPQLGRILAAAILSQLFDVQLPAQMPELGPNERLSFRQRKRELTKVYQDKATAGIAASPIVPIASPRRMKRKYCLTSDFDLVGPGESDGLQGSVRYRMSDRSLQMRIALEGESTWSRVALHIDPKVDNVWALPLSNCEVSIENATPLGITLAWKVVEEYMRIQFGAADLVQVAGYYQNQLKINAVLDIEGPGQALLATVLKAVVSGSAVGAIYEIEVMADAWGLKPSEARRQLDSLKDLGYEVRSQRTNPQIAENSFLIPYPFPTLTPRSIQLRKSL